MLLFFFFQKIESDTLEIPEGNIKTKSALILVLQRLHLNTNGTYSTLKKELQLYLKELSSTYTEKNFDRCKICFRNKEMIFQSITFEINNSNVLYAASPSLAPIVALELKYDGVGILTKIN